MKLMLFSTLLWIVFDTTTPDLRKLHIWQQLPVNLVAKVGQSWVRAPDHHRLAVVRHLAPRLGLDSDQVQSVPNHVLQPVQIPLQEG